MKDDQRNALRDALNAPKPTKDPVPEVNVDKDFLERVNTQWRSVIEPELREFEREIVARGHRVRIEAPTLETFGRFSIEGEHPESHWAPGATFDLAEASKEIRVTVTAGAVKKNQPVTKTLKPEELTGDVVAELIVDLVRRAFEAT